MNERLRRLPSLNILTVFEAAARHQSFKKAAEELFISPPAVSFQIKTLEKFTGVKLFVRLNKRLELTQAGQAYFAAIQPGLAALHDATATLLRRDKARPFVISAFPHMANTLLIPCLQELRKQFPELQLEIRSDRTLVDLLSGQADIAVRYAKDMDTKLHYEPFIDLQVSPVCSPEFFRTRIQGANQRPELNIIKIFPDDGAWSHWSQSWKPAFQEDVSLRVDTYQAVLDAAAQGMGLAIGYLPIINEVLNQGTLLLPFRDQICDYGKIFVVCRKKDSSDPDFKAVISWIKALKLPALSQEALADLG